MHPTPRQPCIYSDMHRLARASGLGLYTKRRTALRSALIHALRAGQRLVFQAADRIGQNARDIVNLSQHAVDHMHRTPCGGYIAPATDCDACRHLGLHGLRLQKLAHG